MLCIFFCIEHSQDYFSNNFNGVLRGREFWKCSGASNALNYRAWGIPAVLLRRIPGKVLRAFPAVFPEFFRNFFRKVPAVLGVWPNCEDYSMGAEQTWSRETVSVNPPADMAPILLTQESFLEDCVWPLCFRGAEWDRTDLSTCVPLGRKGVVRGVILRSQNRHSSSLVLAVICVSTQMWRTVQVMKSVQILARLSFISWSFLRRHFRHGSRAGHASHKTAI